jgi:hypothetical protein
MFRNKETLDPLLAFLRAYKYDGHVSFSIIAVFNHLETVATICSNYACPAEILKWHYINNLIFSGEKIHSFSVKIKLNRI